MFRRFRDGLVYPKELLQYRKDKVRYVVLYILFFAVLYSTASFIYLLTFDGLSNTDKESIIIDMNQINDTCMIDNAVLSCDQEVNILVYESGFNKFYINSYTSYDSSIYKDDVISIVVNQHSVFVNLSGTEAIEYKLSDLPENFQNLDFGLQGTNTTLFYETLFSGVDELLISTIYYWGAITILSEIFMSMLLFLFFISISAYFMKRRFKIIPFNHLFVLTTYSSTGLFVILIFDSITNLDFFLIIIMLFLAFRQNSQLNREIDRRLRNKS